MNMKNLVYQFKLTIRDIEPLIWRRIQVPAVYSFWDLHIAIQDAIGWLDYHLHAFRIPKPGSKKDFIEIGIPGEEFDDQKTLPGWEVPISEYFTEPGIVELYEYDFGDSWEVDVLLEGILLKEKGVKYPRCLAGERACPPEDCGGVSGYYELLETLADRKHPEYKEIAQWVKGQTKYGGPYKPEKFDLKAIVFDNPGKRWKEAFSQR
jgi:hypothetical protein